MIECQPEQPPWTIERHLRIGQDAIQAINRSGRREAQPVCHHFSIGVGVEIDRLLDDPRYAGAVYGHLEALLAKQGLEFLLPQLEAWETCSPNLSWLEERVPMLVELAGYNRLIYEGWTWEPADRQPIGACTLSVINNR